jgi:Fe2+ or Zn2+ uptake regulation protein
MFCPPSLGESGFYICDKCNKVIDISDFEIIKEKIVTHIEIQKGVFRPIENINL